MLLRRRPATRGCCTVFDPAVHGPLRALAGTHRVQRVPSSEKQGRRHSSVVTVAVVDERQERFSLNLADVREDRFRSSGNGGQHRNKVESAIRLTHVPSGLVVTATEERSQHQNRQVAWGRLEAALRREFETRQASATNRQRQEATAGDRADRQFTWTQWRDEVKTSDGRRAPYRQALTGRLRSILQP